MALPMQPSLMEIPATEAFADAPELADLADLVLSRYDEFRDIAEAVRESELVIAYVWDLKPYDPTEPKVHDAIAKVTKLGPLPRHLADGKQLAIQFRSWWWQHMDGLQREAVVYHEFCHVHVWRDDKTTELRLKLVDHDIEEFNDVMRRFGAIIPGRQAFIDSHRAWEIANGRGEPDPLRSPEEPTAAPAPGQGEPAERPRRARRLTPVLPVPAAEPADAETTTTISFGGGPEMPLDLANPSDDVKAGIEQLVRGALGIPEPCPFPGCSFDADHEGDHLPPGGDV